AQLRGCRDVGEALGIPCFADDRYEADDLIATLCAPLVKRKHDVVVTTIDKDMAQLVSPSVTFFNWAKGERFGPEEVKERFGVRPEQIVDFLGLAGDAVDNIPGVKGVGPKTAIALLGAFDDLDELYGDLDRVADLEIRGARTLGAKLEAAKDLAFLSRELATVSTEAPASATLQELKLQGPNREVAADLFARWGFGALEKRFRGA
ncbi:MAG: 5'-3' exonuclease H3TH domain-containing protein, partial [Planctomycetota bacterium]